MYPWFFLLAALNRLRQGLTLRRVLHIAAVLIILACIKEFVAVTDVAFLLGFDWGLAMEVFGALMILAARTHTIAAARLLRHKFSEAKNRLGLLMRRGVSRARRTRPQTRRTPPPSTDEDGGFFLPALA
jgi:hypothetical protein